MHLPTKKIINKTHIEIFEINIIDFIKNDCDIKNLEQRDTAVLFTYKDKVLKTCKAIDISKEYKDI